MADRERESDPSNAELEARIAEDPADDAAWHVYADWLTEQGAVRGELAALQLARAKKRLPSLRRKIEALFEKHDSLLFGEWLAKNVGVDDLESYAPHLKWRAGFWERGWVKGDDAASIASSLGCRSAKMMRALDTSIGETDLSPIVATLAKHGPFPLLRRLRIGDIPELGQSDVGSDYERTCKGFAALPAALPELRTLFLCIVENFDFASFPKLTKLKIASMPPREPSLKALFAADLPRLKNLELSFGEGWPGSDGPQPIRIEAGVLAPLAGGKVFPQLKTLAIHAYQEEGTFLDDVKRLFAKSRIESVVIDDDLSSISSLEGE